MIKIETLKVGALSTNCYLIFSEKTRESLIIDPGDSGDFIERKIADLGLNPLAIFATHGHFDHILATVELSLAYQIPFFLAIEDLFLVKKMRESAKHFLGMDPGPPPAVCPDIPKGERLLAKFGFKVLKTLGHTPGSMVYYLPKEKRIISGDLLFASGGVGRTDHQYSNKEELLKSLRRIFKLPGTTRVYPGHGESFLLSDLSLAKQNYS